jgi:hypothetical protein
MDANLLMLGRFGFHLSVKDRTTAAPPTAPTNGDTYIVAASATGDWAGKSGQVALWSSATAAWVFGVPRAGWLAFIEAEGKLSVYAAGAWSTGIAL